MFDKAVLGLYGLEVPGDRLGQVPEPGDRPEQFDWEPGADWSDPAHWSEFVKSAQAATDEAMARMEAGRFLFRRRR